MQSEVTCTWSLVIMFQSTHRVPDFIDQCHPCCDIMGVHGQWMYTLFVQLQDHKGNELITSLSRREVCTLHRQLGRKKNKVLFQHRSLGDVNPTDFHSNLSTFDKLLVAVDTILSNLREVHEFWLRNESRQWGLNV